jgi:hypothetical protein
VVEDDDAGLPVRSRDREDVVHEDRIGVGGVVGERCNPAYRSVADVRFPDES